MMPILIGTKVAMMLVFYGYSFIRYDVKKLDGPFLLWADWMYHMTTFSVFTQAIRKIIAGLHGEQLSVTLTKAFFARTIRNVYVGMLIGNVIVLCLGSDPWIAIGFWFVVILLPIVMFKDIQNKWKYKQQMIRLELPIILSKLLMLVEAGETVQRAIRFTVPTNRQGHPLYDEFARLITRIDQQVPMSQALEECNQRCPVKELRWFIQAISLNYKRGGDHLTRTLRELSTRLWSERQATARILGEEASSKLLFPMILMFGVVMMIVATPAIMWLGKN